MLKTIATLGRRYSRRALPKPNAVYFLWRFVANTSGMPFTEGSLSVDRMPAWISSDIQRWAVKPLLGRARAPASTPKKKKKSLAAELTAHVRTLKARVAGR